MGRRLDARTRPLREVGVTRRVDLMGVDEVPEGDDEVGLGRRDRSGPCGQPGRRVSRGPGNCSHEYFELDKGFLTGETITCALHLSRFDLFTGDPLDPPAEAPLAIYQVEVEDGPVRIEVPEGPLEINE